LVPTAGCQILDLAGVDGDGTADDAARAVVVGEAVETIEVVAFCIAIEVVAWLEYVVVLVRFFLEPFGAAVTKLMARARTRVLRTAMIAILDIRYWILDLADFFLKRM
jgi:hypothetical protein